MTQIEAARKGLITDEMKRVAERENVTARFIRDQVARGHLIIPANQHHLKPHGRLDPIGIGRAVTTKVNANIGASPVQSSKEEELAKLRHAVKYGADTVMDLSTGGDLNACREYLIRHSPVPIGTVPIYQMIVGKTIEDLTYDDILKTVETQAKQGVDYFTIHAGILREHLPLLKHRIAGIVSRGGSLLTGFARAAWPTPPTRLRLPNSARWVS